MANQDHIEILKMGVKSWNKWRTENPDIIPDLSETKITKLDLRKINLRNANLSQAKLVGVDFQGSDIVGADLSGADLEDSNLRRVKLIGSNLTRSNLSRAELINADLTNADLEGANLYRADLSGAKFVESNLMRADLRQVQLSRADLYIANLSHADLRGADLGGVTSSADFIKAKIVGADFSHTDLINAVGITKKMLESAITDEDTKFPYDLKESLMLEGKEKSIDEIKKILWVSDGTAESEDALNVAVFLALTSSAQIIGVYVKEDRLDTINPILKEEICRAMEEAEKKQKVIFCSHKAKLAQRNIHFEGRVLKGEVIPEICKFAKDTKADLIIMGARSRGLVSTKQLGSPTSELLRNSDIPMIVFRKTKGEDDKEFSNLLVTVDLFNSYKTNSRNALVFANKIGARVNILNVVSFGSYDYLATENVIDKSILHAHKELKELVNELKSDFNSDNNNSGMGINIDTIYGVNIGQSINKYAKDNGIDLIILQDHLKRGITKENLSCVTEDVVQHAHCSVLVIK